MCIRRRAGLYVCKHAMLVCMLRDLVEFHDPSADHFDRRDRSKLADRLLRRLEEVGLRVKSEAAA